MARFRDEQVQAAGIAEFVILILALGFPDRGVRQHAPRVTPDRSGLHRPRLDAMNQKN